MIAIPIGGGPLRCGNMIKQAWLFRTKLRVGVDDWRVSWRCLAGAAHLVRLRRA